MNVESKIQELQSRRIIFLNYLNDRVKAEDCHGVMDASADLREIDVALKIYKASLA